MCIRDRACAEALAQAGCIVVINGRDQARLATAAKEIATATGAKVIPVAADVTTPEGRALLLLSLIHI